MLTFTTMHHEGHLKGRHLYVPSVYLTYDCHAKSQKGPSQLDIRGVDHFSEMMLEMMYCAITLDPFHQHNKIQSTFKCKVLENTALR